MKLTVTGSKKSPSFYVQKSIRKDNGSVTTVTVEKLGNIDEVRTRAGGGDPYKWAREYVDELNRKAYEEQKSILISRSPSKLINKDESHSYNCGYLFLQKVYYSLGFDKICRDISKRYSFEYNLNDILSKLLFTRILYPSSKLSSTKQASVFIEQPSFHIHDVYRALSVLAKESDYIQSALYKNSRKVIERRSDILYYDCTNYYFEIEQEDDLRKYGKSKQHQPHPIVGMGLFMDYDGIPLAFDIFPGNRNEKPMLKPLEQKVIKEYGIDKVIVCTDAGLSSAGNRKFNDLELGGERVRSFITTQSIKQLSDDLKDYALDPEGWSLTGDNRKYNINSIDSAEYYDKTFYKDRWIKEDISERKIRNGAKPLEQHLIVTFSFKYQNYQRKVRQGQIERAEKLIDSGEYKQKKKNPNDPARFIGRQSVTSEGEICEKEIAYLDTDVIANEAQYDGFYAVCTNISDMSLNEIININHRRWEIEECFRIMKTEFNARPVYLQKEDRIKAHFITCYAALFIFRILEKKLDGAGTCEEIIRTLRNMMMYRPGEKEGYLPAYTRTDLTDRLHDYLGNRTDYEILTDLSMKKIIRESKMNSSKK